MSNSNLYTIKDTVAEEAGPVFQAINDGVAIRRTIQLLIDVPDSEEYKLYRVGTFDSFSMSVTSEEPFEIDFKSQYSVVRKHFESLRISSVSNEDGKFQEFK